MMNDKNVKRSTSVEEVPEPVRDKTKVTDQSAGPQQLYEDRKVKSSDQKKSIAVDPKKIRRNSSKKINKLLLNNRKAKQTNPEK